MARREIVVAENDGRSPDELIAELQAEHQYRPVVVNFLVDESRGLLLVQSAKNEEAWAPVQGGVDVGESLLAAATRETEEEVGIGADDQLSTRILPVHGFLAFQAEWRKRDGYEAGKAYFPVITVIREGVELRPNPEEVGECRWVKTFDEYEEVMSTTNDQKTGITRAFLGLAILNIT